MLPALEKALDEDDISVIAKLFTYRKELLKEKYGKFCINKPKSEFIVSQFEVYFNVRYFTYLYYLFGCTIVILKNLHFRL
jgi:hypothetical protein